MVGCCEYSNEPSEFHKMLAEELLVFERTIIVFELIGLVCEFLRLSNVELSDDNDNDLESIRKEPS
jgi:hypothetical protein